MNLPELWNVFDKPNPDELARMVRRENVGAKKPTKAGNFCPNIGTFSISREKKSLLLFRGEKTTNEIEQLLIVETGDDTPGTAEGVAEALLVVVADGDAVVAFVGVDEEEVASRGVVIGDGDTDVSDVAFGGFA